MAWTRVCSVLDHQLTATQSTSCGLCAIMHLSTSRHHAWPRTSLTRTWMNPEATVMVSLDLIGCYVLVQKKYVVIYSYCIKYVSLWSSTCWGPCNQLSNPDFEGSFIMADRSGPCYDYIQRWKEPALPCAPNRSSLVPVATSLRSPANAGSADCCSH